MNGSIGWGGGCIDARVPRLTLSTSLLAPRFVDLLGAGQVRGAVLLPPGLHVSCALAGFPHLAKHLTAHCIACLHSELLPLPCMWLCL